MPLPLNTAVDSVSVVWVYGSETNGALTVAHIAITDNEHAVAHPLYADDQFTTGHSHFVECTNIYHDGSERVLENRNTFPHAWLADRMILANPEEQLQAIETGEFKGHPIDFHRVAFYEDSATLESTTESNHVTVVSSSPTAEADSVTCAHPCALITNDLWYPGWNASIDGKGARVVPVDYAFRGVIVPAGTHRVSTWFAPLSLYIGIAISVSAGFLLIISVCSTFVRRYRPLTPTPITK